MYDPIENALGERLDLIARLQSAFAELYPEFPKKLPRGQTQRNLLTRVESDLSGRHRQLVSEALWNLGYDKVKIRGLLYYRKRGNVNATQ